MKNYKTNITDPHSNHRFKVEISAEEIKRLIKENPELLEEKTHKPWRAESAGEYWFVDDEGDVDSEEDWGHNSDNHRYLTGNYFQTKEEAIAYGDRLEAIGRVTHAIFEANDNWEPDWKSGTDKYFLEYSHTDESFLFDCWSHYQHASSLPYIASGEIAERIITDHEADLRIIFKLDN